MDNIKGTTEREVDFNVMTRFGKVTYNFWELYFVKYH